MAVSGAQRLAWIHLNCRAPGAAADFFERALGFSRLEATSRGVPVLSLGPSLIVLADAQGRDYPAEVPGWSRLFQHFAIVTADMEAAMARLGEAPGWRAISLGGPQRLPASSGGVTAFKFRDPEGHPLELIQFPAGKANSPLRIDHSAISVADTATSIAFYEALGLTRAAGSVNHGPAQAKLDGESGVNVEVTPLMFPGGGAHVELLCYRGGHATGHAQAARGDIAATQLVLTVPDQADLDAVVARLSDRVEGDRSGEALLRDPDGHLLWIVVES